MKYLLLPLLLFLRGTTTDAQGGQIQDRVNALLQPYLTTDGPGGSLCIVKDGSIVYLRSFGYANLEYRIPVDTSTRFHIASCSKQFTAYCIVDLAMKNLVNLDADIHAYIPELPDFHHKITVRNLLSHTSGIREWQELFWLSNWNDDELITHEKVFKKLLQQKQLNTVPGERFMYSNSNYDLLAEIVLRVTKKPLNEYATKNVFGPLGLYNTSYLDDKNKVINNRAYGYKKNASGFEISGYNDVVAGSARLYISMGDMIRWNALFYSHDPEIIRHTSLLRKKFILNSGDSVHYGMGLQLNKYKGYILEEHSGSLRADRAYVARLPEAGVSIVFLSNSADILPWQMGTKILDTLYGLLIPARDSLEKAIMPKMPGSPIDYSALAGIYRPLIHGKTNFISFKDGRLFNEEAELVRYHDSVFRNMGNTAFEYSFFQKNGKLMLNVSRFSDVLTTAVFDGKATPDINLAEYAGDYYAPELGQTYIIDVDAKKMVLHKNSGTRYIMEPAYADAFENEPIFLNFCRKDNRVVGFNLSTYQDTDIYFERR